MKPLRCFLLIFLLSAGDLKAQSAAEIDRILAQNTVCWSDVCVWTFASHGEPYSERDAAFYAIQFKAMPPNAAFDDNANLAGLALLIMRVYDFKGGLFYSMFKNRRYAFREMVYRGIFENEDDPADSFSGVKFLDVLSRVSRLR